MKRLNKLRLLLVFVIWPFVSVNAFEIYCDEGMHDFEEFFTCRLTGADVDSIYDVLSGTITNNEYVNCLRDTDGEGLVNQNTTDNKVISYKGKPETKTVSTFRCQVIKKAEEKQNVQIFINDFKSHTNNQVGSAVGEIVRSNFIIISKYTGNTNVKPTKPRDTSNSGSRLKTLSDDNLNMTFSSFITEYNTEVLYDVEKLNLKITPYNSDASVKIVGSQNLNVGLNVIDIYVVSPDEKFTTCYTLNVTRLEEGESIYYPASDASLKNLTVTGFAIGFTPDVAEYKIHLDNQTTKVEVNAIPNVETATVNISDTNNLTNGSVISVTITSEDLSNQMKYRILITKDVPKKDYTSYIVLGVLGFLGIIVVIIIIYTSKKNKKDLLLGLKKDKKKSKKGKKINQNVIPEVGVVQNPMDAQVNQVQVPNMFANASQVNNGSSAQPMQMAGQDINSNLNGINENPTSLDLNASANIMPQTGQVYPTNASQSNQYGEQSLPNQGMPQYQINQGMTQYQPQAGQNQIIQSQANQQFIQTQGTVPSPTSPQTVNGVPLQPPLQPANNETMDSNQTQN